MEIKHDSAAVSPGTRFFEVNLIAMACGIWEWQVCHDKEAIACGYAATRELAQSGGYTDLFLLLSKARPD